MIPFPNFSWETLSPSEKFILVELFSGIEDDSFLKFPLGLNRIFFFEMSFDIDPNSIWLITSTKSLSISFKNLLSSQYISFPHLYLELAYDKYKFSFALVIPT